jgi:hypothetical protein
MKSESPNQLKNQNMQSHEKRSADNGVPRRRIFRAYQLLSFRLNLLSESQNFWDSRLWASGACIISGLIHNSWDEKSRNFWDSSIIYGTASQADPCLAGPHPTLETAATSGTASSGRPQEPPWRRESARPKAARRESPPDVAPPPHSRGSMLSKSMDSLAVSLQSGSTNYESNSTPVPGIVNQSRNCATGNSLDFNERESQKLRQSDSWTGFALHHWTGLR